MINPIIFQFLKDLEENNNRDWFTANKKYYLKANDAVKEYVANMIREVSMFDENIKGIEPKQCIFRIYRDVRFSKDKSPYKLNFGGFLVKNGRRSGNAGYYLHLENKNSFIAGGIHMPPSPELKKIRKEVYYNIDEFKKVINEPDLVKSFGNISGEKLVRPPKDFPADFPDIDLLKFKSYAFAEAMSNELCLSENFFELLMEKFKTLKPFIKFINRGLSM
jgi:uncharacterized protein (TIGR02453 family)